ncbi:hypothetical protein [Bacteroides mediterraneensis]|uniref:Uncharacterized protein n=1 Tax=Bacteroides mediterraneensis TaxID=1841856 RepID=A0ABS2EZR2_9BACE|nr:hypothetical protein [Bacteroides mediterraneensis]MBM6759734.1 hypothetical protein [Bacteroides mediterraneensis]
MRPRTKRERLVAELSSKLSAITEAQIRWGKKHCFPHNAYRCKDEIWCSECGKMWVDVTGQKEGYIKCPYCGERLEVKVSRKTKDNAVSYLTVVTTSGDFQVLRHFYTARYARKERDTHYFTDEVCQQWITSDKKETVIAKSMNMWSTSWIHTTDMSIKQNGNIYCSHSYDIDGYVYPKVKLLPVLHRNGLRTSFHGITPAVLIRALLGERKYAEMLLKTKQYGMLYFYMNRGGFSYPWVVNICNRNGYIIKDGSMYDDYIHLLDYFHLDTHNAQYDKIIANPPFSKNQDIRHVRRMYECLNSGGVLAAITGPHWEFGSESECNDFRQWLEDNGGKKFEIEEGAFKESGTGTKTIAIVINK